MLYSIKKEAINNFWLLCILKTRGKTFIFKDQFAQIVQEPATEVFTPFLTSFEPLETLLKICWPQNIFYSWVTVQAFSPQSPV